ncbi:MAG: hydantoinase B/oxoprolinase family protein, partial [Gaiellales bacterium]
MQQSDVDPVTFEIVRHKLLNVMDEAIIALENVSGSPITNEGHDLMVSLYEADGGLMVGGVGFLHHLTSAAQAVKHVIATFADDPGIHEDDVFFFNDSYTAALHPPDVYIISPLHHDGELTGFVANFVHVTDIGAVDPGGFSPNARDNYQEGFQTKGLKIVEGGKPRRDVLDTFLNQVRDPGMTALDLKSQLAANHVAKQRMARLYTDYGVETVRAVSDTLIEQSERLVRARLSELPDGEWRAREYIDMPGGSCTVELTAIKAADELTYDFTGSGGQVELGINCCYWATWGGMFAPIFPLLAWDITWNEGVTRPISLVAPEGTVVNCIRPAPVSIATVGTIQIVNNLSTIVLSKMLGASEKYRHRATAVWHGSHAHLETHGLDESGEFYVAPLTDTFGGAAGARAFRDGVDLGGEIPNVVSRWANAESQELNTPLVYLYRRAVPDSGGPGKYRGGVCHEYAFSPNRTGKNAMGLTLFGKGTRAPMSLGIFGGYPGCNVGYSTFRESDLEHLPAALSETAGATREDVFWGSVELAPGDVQYVRF